MSMIELLAAEDPKVIVHSAAVPRMIEAPIDMIIPFSFGD